MALKYQGANEVMGWRRGLAFSVEQIERHLQRELPH
jgi:hypothetical protein